MHANALQGCVIQTVQHVWERIRTKEGCKCKGEAASELFRKNLSIRQYISSITGYSASFSYSFGTWVLYVLYS